MKSSSVRGTPYTHVTNTRSEGMMHGAKPKGMSGTVNKQFEGDQKGNRQVGIAQGTPYQSMDGNSDEFVRVRSRDKYGKVIDDAAGDQANHLNNGNGVILDGIAREMGYTPMAAATMDSPVMMGAPRFDARIAAPAAGLDEIVDREFAFGTDRCRITFVSMGNPHCVVTGMAPSEALACRLGPVIERSPMFPAKTNVQFLQVLSRSEILIEIWERGAGYTLASGSSSCGAAAAARKLGLVDDEVTVHMPGGVLQVTFAGGSAHLVGPVEKVMEGSFADDLLARIRAGELC